MYKLTAVQVAFLVAKLGNSAHVESYIYEQLELARGGSANMMRGSLDSERREVFDAVVAALEVDSMNRETPDIELGNPDPMAFARPMGASQYNPEQE